MTRLIDADALLIKIDEANYTAIDIKNLIEEAQTIEQDSEPVAWALFYENGVVNHVTKTVHPTMNGSHLKYKPLYTSPPKREWRGLSDEQVGMLSVFDGLTDIETPILAKFIRTIEAKSKEVNGYD